MMDNKINHQTKTKLHWSKASEEFWDFVSIDENRRGSR